MSEVTPSTVPEKAGSPDSEILSPESLRKVAAAVGIEHFSDSDLQQLQLDLTSRSQREGRPVGALLIEAIEQFARTHSKQVVVPPNPLKSELKYDSGKLGKFTLDDARIMAEHLKLPLKDETLQDYLEQVKREAGKGKYLGQSEQDLMADILGKMAIEKRGKRSFFTPSERIS